MGRAPTAVVGCQDRAVAIVGVDQIDVLVGMIVFLVLLLLVSLGAWAYMRMGDSEERSMKGYHSTLETLEDIGSRSSSRGVRVLHDADRASEGEPDDVDRWITGTAPPGRAAVPPIARTFDPDRSGEGPFEDTSVRGVLNAPPAPKVQARALTAMNRRPRRLGAPIAVAIVVLAVLAAVIAIGAHSNHNKPRTTATTVPATSATTVPATSATTVPSAGHAKSSVTTKPSSKKSSSGHSTTTTVALPTKFTASTSSANTATYDLPSSGYQITFTTVSGACWVNVAAAPNGTTVFSQTIPVGTSKVVAASGQTTVVLGAPSAVTVTVDHEPVVLPSGYQTPFTMTFRPPT